MLGLRNPQILFRDFPDVLGNCVSLGSPVRKIPEADILRGVSRAHTLKATARFRNKLRVNFLQLNECGT